MRGSSVKSIRSLARGLEVLQHLQGDGAKTLAVLHAETGVPKASLMRILKTLAEQGMIWQRMADDAWVPSYSLAELAGRIDREHALVEVASPVLESLSDRFKWPSVLAVPRLTHMEVIETNASRAYFDDIPLGPVGFRIPILRSASGRAWLAACEAPEREAVLAALRRSGHVGDRMATDDAQIARLVLESRAQGYALRDPDFGGDFDARRSVVDDGRDSLGVAIVLGGQEGGHAAGAINITWSRRVFKRGQAVAQFSAPVREAARAIAEGLAKRL
jgi:IclR family transcriptional regulator, mhp operon transcriptional activator